MKILRNATIAAMLLGTPAAAQQLYVGAAYDYALPHSGPVERLGTVIAGIALDLMIIDITAEAEYGQPFWGVAGRETTRVRLLETIDLGPLKGFTSFGWTEYKETGSFYKGYNFGLGGQLAFSPNMDVRLEWIRDMMDDPYPTNITTTRLAAIFTF